MATVLVFTAVMTVFVAIAIALIVLSKKDKRKNIYDYNKKLDFAATAITVIAGFMIICLLITGIAAGIASNAKIKYNVLESRYEQLNETYKFYRYVANDEGWLEELYDYNNEVFELKEEANNVWTNWFVNRKRIADLKVIEFQSGYPVFATD